MQHKVIDTTDVVIRFAGDSGDGMQLTGSLFADMSAIYPAFRSISEAKM